MPHLVHCLGTRIPLTLHAYIAIGLLGLLQQSLSHFTSIGISANFDLFSFVSTLFGSNPSHTHLHTSLRVVSHLYHHRLRRSSALLNLTCHPHLHSLTNSTPTTSTVGMVTWRLGFALRRSGASFPAHPPLPESARLPRMESRRNSKHG